MAISETLEQIDRNRGKSAGWPSAFEYRADGTTLLLRADRPRRAQMRQIDPWALAFLAEVRRRCGADLVSGLRIELTHVSPKRKAMLEAFRRRISYLAANNPDLAMSVAANQVPMRLDDGAELLRPGPDEKIHEDFVDRTSDDEGGRLEKDFQAFLYGKGIGDRQDDRLAVLGEAFIGAKGRSSQVIREFPTGAFAGEVRDANRILPTNYVDLVALDKHRQLTLVELKLDSSPLELVAQLLDYALFFARYRTLLWPSLVAKLGSEPKSRRRFEACMAANRFHKRMPAILRYYAPHGGRWPFGLHSIHLGLRVPFA